MEKPVYYILCSGSQPLDTPDAEDLEGLGDGYIREVVYPGDLLINEEQYARWRAGMVSPEELEEEPGTLTVF